MSQAYRHSAEMGLIDSNDTLVIFMDLSILEDRIERLKQSFGSNTLHAIAIKTNPMSFVLKHLADMQVGLEAASFGEVCLAENAGLMSERLVFDSPAKTEWEIAELRSRFRGARVNADSIDELNRYPTVASGLRIGLRINPLVQTNTISYMSVSDEHSKFGESIVQRSEIIDACNQWQDLDCLHLHIGSQVTNLNRTVDAVRKILELGQEINDRAGKRKISTIDIGGGFPVNYGLGDPFRVEEYAFALSERCPELFDGRFNLITEFGRYVHANACWAVANIEYVKPIPGSFNLITHAGADLFLRECYNPGDWFHKIFLLDRNGFEKYGEDQKVNIAGPLCFGGDFVERNIEIPKATPGDHIVFCDVGANTFSLWSKHCSRQFPKVITFNSRNGLNDFRIGKQRETFDSIIDFWS